MGIMGLYRNDCFLEICETAVVSGPDCGCCRKIKSDQGFCVIAEWCRLRRLSTRGFATCECVPMQARAVHTPARLQKKLRGTVASIDQGVGGGYCSSLLFFLLEPRSSAGTDV